MKKLKLLIRKNLKMSANKLGGQCAHATPAEPVMETWHERAIAFLAGLL